MSDQNTGIYNTIMSYIPGSEDYKKSTQHSEEEHHKYSTEGAAGATGNTGASTDGSGSNDKTSYGQGSGLSGNTGSAFQNHTAGPGSGTSAKYGTEGDYYTDTGLDSATGQGAGGQRRGQYAGNDDAGYKGGYAAGQDTRLGNDSGYTSGNITGQDRQTGGTYTPSDYGSKGTGAEDTYGNGRRSGLPGTNADSTYGTTGAGLGSGSHPSSNYSSDTDGSRADYKKPIVAYESGADDTGTHYSGYNPQSSTPGAAGNQTRDDGVRGAPIEGEDVKGYAIGSQVGSGDTENPKAPGDPSGQVAGSHLEYRPKDTDTRDASGRGTVGQSAGTGDSSFANVKTTDGQGNSSHVVTRQSTSQMHSSSVTQL